MNEIVSGIVALALVVPALWFASEFLGRRWLRLVLGSISILLSIVVAVAVGSAERFNSNAWFGVASKSLVDATVEELEAGNQDRVIRALKLVQANYHPTYENRARYDVLVEQTIAEMGRPPSPLP
jgi:hypothetical protein